jgi:hypothetical protein
MAIRVGVLPPGVGLRISRLDPGTMLLRLVRVRSFDPADSEQGSPCQRTLFGWPQAFIGSADRKGVGRDPRYQAGQTLRRRFAQKPGEDEGSCVFALTISWSSASRLRRSPYPFSATSSTSSTVASLMPIPSTVQPFRRTCLSAIPLTRRPVRRWSLGTSQSIITTEAPLPGPLDVSPSLAGVGVSTHPV